MKLGVHCSIRNGFINALEEAHSLSCQTLQIFTRSPRIWKKREVKDEEIILFKKKRKEYNLSPLIIHIPYLPNLATQNQKLLQKSKNILKEDISIAKRLDADYIIVHPGAFSFGSTRENGIKRIVSSVSEALNMKDGNLTLLFENVSGEGRKIGATFEELSILIEGLKQNYNVGICLDTAHLFTAGYDISNKKNVNSVLNEFDRVVGLKYLRVIHLNDSSYPMGSKRDRHAHIGKGFIGKKGLKAFLNHPYIKNLPVILETPKKNPGDDRRNLNSVRKIINN